MRRIVEAADRGALARLLADEVAGVLAAAVRDAGRAALAVPGGTTPAAFLTALGARALDWAAVAVTLTDERCVPSGHPRSNRRLLDETLFAGPARAARFVALDDAHALSALLPLDACVLGMGEDRHIASLFPARTAWPTRFRRTARRPPCGCAPPARRSRASRSPRRRCAGRAGASCWSTAGAKRAALERAGAAAGPAEAPVRLVLDGPNPARVYWAP